MAQNRQTNDIRQFILKNITDSKLVSLVGERFDISRTAVYNNINQLVTDGLIMHDGNKKCRKYELVSQERNFSYLITDVLSESAIWTRDIECLMPAKTNVRNIWSYGFTEIFNNAIDHSEGTRIDVKILSNAVNTTMFIYDNGVGIFRKIKEKFNLLNEHEAILELSKGKLTTDITQHSGQGIFFTSRAFDEFCILSRNVFFSHNAAFDADIADVIVPDMPNPNQGTSVMLKISNDSDRILADVFDDFSGEDYGFDKTVIPIQLARYGDENLVSRSQAKRVLARADMFKNIVLDLSNVPQVGQAFADEIFRVFVNSHPNISVEYINANADVEKMIKRAKLSQLDYQ